MYFDFEGKTFEEAAYSALVGMEESEYHRLEKKPNLEFVCNRVNDMVFFNKQRYTLFNVQAAVTHILQDKPHYCIQYVLNAHISLIQLLMHFGDCPQQAPDVQHKMGGRFYRGLYNWLSNTNTTKKIQKLTVPQTES